jgi:hypothetical protein
MCADTSSVEVQALLARREMCRVDPRVLFIGWIRANPREVADSEIAMLVLDKMDEGPDSQGEGAALKSILQEMLALPTPIEPPSWVDDVDDTEAQS